MDVCNDLTYSTRSVTKLDYNINVLYVMYTLIHITELKVLPINRYLIIPNITHVADCMLGT